MYTVLSFIKRDHVFSSTNCCTLSSSFLFLSTTSSRCCSEALPIYLHDSTENFKNDALGIAWTRISSLFFQLEWTLSLFCRLLKKCGGVRHKSLKRHDTLFYKSTTRSSSGDYSFLILAVFCLQGPCCSTCQLRLSRKGWRVEVA
jgi:hypothetical protein